MGCKLLPVFLYISTAWLIAARMDFVLKSIHKVFMQKGSIVSEQLPGITHKS